MQLGTEEEEEEEEEEDDDDDDDPLLTSGTHRHYTPHTPAVVAGHRKQTQRNQQ
jgi:hypothetical protein